MAVIGKRNTLTVLRDSAPGLYLDGGEHGEILLPNRYVPRGFKIGDRLEVFVYRDSEDRLVATTETPRATVGETATLKVIGVNRQVGAFLDWGLAKDLLLPFREQTGLVRMGQEVTVRIYLDEKTQRIVASMKLDRETSVEPHNYRAGQPVELLISEKTDLGFKALVEGKHSGLLYHDGISVPVKIGMQLKGFVRALRPDGKIDLTFSTNPATAASRHWPCELSKPSKATAASWMSMTTPRPKRFARPAAQARQLSTKPSARSTNPAASAFPIRVSSSSTTPPGHPAARHRTNAQPLRNAFPENSRKVLVFLFVRHKNLFQRNSSKFPVFVQRS